MPADASSSAESASRERGRLGERLAVRFLKKLGYKILQRNYSCPRGEIDIVALDEGEIVFVEVKARRDESFGLPAESLTPAKMRQISRVAADYVWRKKINGSRMRFDAVMVTWDKSGAPRIEHFRDAFPLHPGVAG